LHLLLILNRKSEGPEKSAPSKLLSSETAPEIGRLQLVTPS